MTLRGFHHTKETKRKIREHHKGMLGLKHSKKTKEKMSQKKKGHLVSRKVRKKISRKLKGNIIPWNKGKKNIYSKKTLLNMSKNHVGTTGMSYSKKSRRKMSKWQIGKKFSEETLKKMRKPHGNPKRPDTIHCIPKQIISDNRNLLFKGNRISHRTFDSPSGFLASLIKYLINNNILSVQKILNVGKRLAKELEIKVDKL